MSEELKNKDYSKARVDFEVNTDEESVDFKFIFPKNCPYAEAKRATMACYEFLVRVEYDTHKAEQAQKTEEKVESVEPEVV
jgi:hypothetical protein